MSTNELLYPRYKVIAPFFHMNCKVGDIIDFSDGYSTKQLTRTPYDDQWGETLYATHGFDETEIKDYPHLFKKLEWSEERTLEEMPQFIKHDERVWKITKWGIDMTGEFFPVINEKNVMEKLPSSASICWHFNSAKILPATIAEYEQYINQKHHQ